MAVILLQAAGAALGGMLGPLGAALGQAAGALAGNLVDNALLGGGKTVKRAGLSGARIPSAEEGSAIPRVHGTARVAGALIWATRFEEVVTVERSGGKAGSGGKTQTSSYFGSFAMGLCEGPIASVRRVWADGRELDLAAIEMRVHTGEDTQMPDPLIEAKQGAGAVPAWRGLAYVVFERLPLDGFGNRIPVLNFEVIRPIGELENRIEAVTVIPGATEHGYALTPISELRGQGARTYLNRHTRQIGTDWAVSIDELQALCPNLKSVALVCAWFGDDLRARECRLMPGIEERTRNSESRPWRVGNADRDTARLISRIDGSPVYGGTPADAAVIEAITDLKARGLKVVLYPFVLMDIVAGNGLPDPQGASEQPALPWRGRITTEPAPGRVGSPDKTAAIAAEIVAFCGETDAADIVVSGSTVNWTGGDWGYRRMILHHAGLALAAGGVDGFLLGSELKGLTRLRDDTGAFPFVDALTDLAADVAALLGASTTLTYGADWSEYNGYAPDDGSGDFFFNLDPLWSHAAIGAIAIDNYMPLSDWRDGDLETGNPDGERHAGDRLAMASAIAAGEGYDWYYQSPADRQARLRTPIIDGSAGKPWVYRAKDLRGWWQSLHYDRTAGIEASEPTAWVPASKPIWFSELGCPAVDKGAVEPNVFPDGQSSEGTVPSGSTSARDDAVQRAFLNAHFDYWNGAANADDMVARDRLFVWTWDARPFPVFPTSQMVWADHANWRTGHWLNGRLGGADLADVIAAILAAAGFSRFDVTNVSGAVSGHLITGLVSPRQILEPLLDAFAIDMHEGADGLHFVSRLKLAQEPHQISVVVDPADAPRFDLVRRPDAELPAEAMIRFADPLNDHETASVRSRRLATGDPRVAALEPAVALDTGVAARVIDGWLKDRWAARRELHCALPPGRVDVEPGDLVQPLFEDAPSGLFRVTRIEDGASRRLTLTGHAAIRPYEPLVTAPSRGTTAFDSGYAPTVLFADLPLLEGSDEGAWAVAGASVVPWRAAILAAASGNEGYRQRARIEAPAHTGRLAADLPPGQIEGRFDRAASLIIDLDYGGFDSLSRQEVLDGGNVLAVAAGNGAWEIIQFEQAEEIAAGRWQLTSLLRGQSGTDDAMTAGAAAGAATVLLDEALVSLAIAAGEAGLERNFILEPVGLSGESATDPVAFAGGLRARTPLSPVHLRAARSTDGIAFTWIRRSRTAADSWLASEIGLGEDLEGYRVEVLDGSTVLREAQVTETAWLYPAADEIADFGAPQTTLTVRVSQAGTWLPWGVPRTATLFVP
ncbi:baseplate multidomain protein megatron [Pseudohoeflea coraliihabitans]|uniref:Glycoside hydrolase/phage tail family protein n=1 Tax=Pseudohoeflea coraliihabitans TaxID=2860393 RepID=A0ABS6WRT1_9HYPH|nr:glycoside hydrolase/phage tail family protein [Pseudohoeflea sp. DP4N28-3]MBW3098671.1 glycoside hydrolase/phage tail family protein [Pseudohoeflea sp. DP4N28-3]